MSNAICFGSFVELRGRASQSLSETPVESSTLTLFISIVQTYKKHNTGNKKSAFLWVNMFQSVSYPFKPQCVGTANALSASL